jgi:NADPH-dependent ferric siderophore reductase
MRRVTLTGPTLEGMQTRPGQDVEIILTAGSGRRVKRRYTIRRARPEVAEIDVDVLVHGRGPGSSWAATAAPGDAAEFLGPRGKLELRPADWHLFVGDEAAIPAFASFIEALAPAEIAIVLVEVGDASDELPFARAAGEVSVQWIHRQGAAAGGAGLLAVAVASVGVPPGAGRAYLLGESRAVVALRAPATALGLAHDQVFVKGYWNLGVPGRAIPE